MTGEALTVIACSARWAALSRRGVGKGWWMRWACRRLAYVSSVALISNARILVASGQEKGRSSRAAGQGQADRGKRRHCVQDVGQRTPLPWGVLGGGKGGKSLVLGQFCLGLGPNLGGEACDRGFCPVDGGAGGA